MAPPGRQARVKGDEGAMEKYVAGGEDGWKNGLERIIKEIGDLRSEMKGELEMMKEQMREERRIREEERRKEKEEWSEEKKIIEKRLTDLEWMNERVDRQNRKKNIIIKGLSEGKKMVEQDVEKFIEEALRIEVKIKRVSEIKTKGKNKWMLAELESWEQKKEVMEKKKNLEKSVRIEDDLTKKEREIQEKLRVIAREEREKGDVKVRIGYKKIFLKQKWYWWNEREDKLQEGSDGRKN